MSTARTWKCPRCGLSLEISYNWLAEHGGPVCEHCDCDMDLQPAADDEKLAVELPEIGKELLEWADTMGGWEAKCWTRLRTAMNKAAVAWNPTVENSLVATETASTPAPKIVLSMSGGLLQDVFGSDPAITVALVDWDTEGCDPSDNGIVEIPDGRGGTQLAHVAEYPVCPLKELVGTETEAALKTAGLELPQPADSDRTAGRTIQLPCYGITLTLARENGAEEPGSGSIVSDLRDPETAANRQYNAAIDGLEALILAHACAGVDVESPAYLEGIETAVDSIANEYGST